MVLSMKISLIAGSQRLNSQTLKVAGYIQNRLTGLDPSTHSVQTYLLDLGSANLPLAESEPSKTAEFNEAWAKTAIELQDSDGFVLLSPEWNGGLTPAMLNFFLLAGRNLAHKPALLVGVSASRGGAFPISDFRIAGYKNTRIVYLPEHLIIRHVEQVLNDPSPLIGDKDELYLKKRIDFAAQLLLEYAQALKPIRSSQTIDYQTFPNGMQ
jgi:NADPH-dependent FMN reductase